MMTQFARASREPGGNTGEGIEYYYRFINQFIKIPNSISDKVNTDYSTQKIGVRNCIGIILTNLIKYGIVACSKSGRYYNEHRGKHYTKTNMLRAVNLVIQDGYAFTRKGSKQIKYEQGIASRLFPLDKINELPATFDISIDFKTIPLLEIDKNRIYNLRDLKKYVTSATFSSHSILHSSSHTPLPHNGTFYAQSFSESRTLNRRYFNKMVLDFSKIPKLRFIPLDQVCLTRIFNNDECGRWYQKGGLSYQQLSEKERAQILLNGSEVIEVDYSAMHPHILYAWENVQCPNDFYERIARVLGLKYNKKTKFVVKRVTLSSINASGEKNLGKSISHDKYKELKANATRHHEGRAERPILYDELKRLSVDFRQIVGAFRKAHPTVAKFIYSNSANRLMLGESRIMTLVLLQLKKQRIPALPVHDSVIVPVQHKELAKQTMIDCYRKHTGFAITVSW